MHFLWVCVFQAVLLKYIPFEFFSGLLLGRYAVNYPSQHPTNNKGCSREFGSSQHPYVSWISLSKGTTLRDMRTPGLGPQGHVRESCIYCRKSPHICSCCIIFAVVLLENIVMSNSWMKINYISNFLVLYHAI